MRSALRPAMGLAIALLACLAAAADGLDEPEPTLTVTGRAAIYHGDRAGARERATQAALIRALEQYAGLRIEASTLISKGELIGREVRAHTHGYVRSFEVLEETVTGDELAVKVRVTVAEAPVEESFRRLMSATTSLLVVRESNLGRPVDGEILGAVLSDPFFGSAMVVPSAEALASASRLAPDRFFETPDPETAKQLGLRYLSGVIVVASADTTKLDTSEGSIGYDVDPSVLRPVVAAHGNVAILDGQSGQLLASERWDDVRGSDATDPGRAGLEALHDLSQQMKTFIVQALSEHVSQLGFTLRVTVKGPQAANGAPRVRQVLETTRWVEHVELVEEAPDRAVLEVACREKPVYIVEELRQAEEIEVVSFSAAAGELEVR